MFLVKNLAFGWWVSMLQRFVDGVLRKINRHYRPGIVCENY